MPAIAELRAGCGGSEAWVLPEGVTFVHVIAHDRTPAERGLPHVTRVLVPHGLAGRSVHAPSVSRSAAAAVALKVA